MPGRLFLLFILSGLVLLFGGCDSSSQKNETPAAGQNATVSPAKALGPPQYGGRIILGQLGEPSNLIPPLSSDAPSHEVADLIYVAPLKYDKNIELVPWAAESFEILEDGKLLRFRLREGIRWFDGKELTAGDVEFTYKMMIDPKTPTAYGEDFKAIKEFRVLDKYGFEVRYDEPFARSLVTWAHPILPKHALERENLLDTKYSREPLGAGAFKLKEWVAGRRLTLSANEDYFEGRPYLDQVVYRIIPDISTMFLELKAGNLDFMGLTPQQYLHQTSGPDWERDFNKFKYLSFGYTYLGYNLSHVFFRDKTVRRALAHAIDKEEIVKGVLLGQGVPVIGPYKPGTWVYNENIKDYAFDPQKASEMLSEAGWRDSDGDGLLDKDGNTFSFTILTNQGNDQRIKTATIIQNRLKKIGIQVKVRTVEWAAFLKEFVDKGRFDAIILGWNITQDPDIYDVRHSSKAVPGGLNFIGYKNPELDALLERGRRILEQDKRKPIYDRVQEILHQDQPYCFLYAPLSLPIVSSRFKDLEPAPAGITHNFIRWWVPKGEQRYTP